MPVLAYGTAPPLDAHHVQLFLLQLGVLLLLALCMGRLAVRCGLPAVVGELTTGILLGPSVFGAVAPQLTERLLPAEADQAHLLDAVAQLAVVMFVGVAAAHMDLGMLRRRRGVIVKVSLGGLLIPMILGVGAGFLVPRALLGDPAERPVFALFLGVALSVCA
ncbi:cation:proton antiporter, partial [Streptomyces sp. NPDC006356]